LLISIFRESHKVVDTTPALSVPRIPRSRSTTSGASPKAKA
jgi:hypothetical protein